MASRRPEDLDGGGAPRGAPPVVDGNGIETLRRARYKDAMITLREYQSCAVQELRLKIRRGAKRLLISAPTGSGKTVVAVYIIASAIAKDSRVLFVAHRRELINQTVAKLIEMGIPEPDIGVIMGKDARKSPGAKVQVASIQTLVRRKLPPAQLVIVDEAHHSMADSYLRVLEVYKNQGGTIVLGMTATPYRADGRGLGDIYDDLSIVATPRELIEDGFLVAPDIWTAPPNSDGTFVEDGLRRINVTAGDYNQEQLGQYMSDSKLVGNMVDHWLQHAKGVKTVVFATTIAHSKEIVSRFRMFGVRASHLDGTMGMDERDSVLHALEVGDIDLVSNCAVLTEGWDQPSVKCCVLARPTKSLGLYIQMAGRILRPYNGQRAIILDHAGCYKTHGQPHDDRRLTLDPSKKRKPDDTDRSHRQCKHCHLVVHVKYKECPNCGHPMVAEPQEPIREEEGQLVKVEDVAPAREPTYDEMLQEWVRIVDTWQRRNEYRKQRGKQQIAYGACGVEFKRKFHRWPLREFPALFADEPMEVKKARYQELIEQADKKGHAETWPDAMFRQMYGQWPDRNWRRSHE